MDAKILVVDDEPAIIELLAYNLQRAHYSVLIARDGQTALEVAEQAQPDLIILDVMLPKVNGLEVCRALRRTKTVPIIMLTALDSELDRVVGLELGADDYVVKPFSPRELLARVKNILRRAAPAEVEAEPVRVRDLSLDNTRREARWNNTSLDLTALEFDLLYTLATHANQVLSREQLLEKVWGYDFYGDARVVDAAIKRLRHKLNGTAPHTDLILTVRGVGYRLAAE